MDLETIIPNSAGEISDKTYWLYGKGKTVASVALADFPGLYPKERLMAIENEGYYVGSYKDLNEIQAREKLKMIRKSIRATILTYNPGLLKKINLRNATLKRKS